MDVMGPFIFLLLALSTPALAAHKGFQLFNQLKTWTEAQSYCRQNFIDLATIEDGNDMAKVDAMVEKSGQTRAWVGLHADPKSWRWSLGNTSLYQQQDLGTWFLFYRQIVLSGQTCGFLYPDGKLYDLDCQYSMRSVCYDETTNSYVVDSVSRSWYQAQSYCRQSYTDLASITNQQQLDAIKILVDPWAWIGLYGEGWMWSDQSTSSYQALSYEAYVGNETCGAAALGHWDEQDCQTKLPFICSVPPQPSKVLKVTVKTDGSVNLNDPLVQEAILKQMEKDLRGQGLTQQLSLSWRKQPHGHVFNKTVL